MPESASPYRGHRFPGEVIARAVRLYPRFAPSFGDVGELPADRGVTASHQTVPRRAARFWASYAEERRRREVRAGPTWHLDETATRVGGQRQWLRRAVDEHGQTLDVLLQAHRDAAAAESFVRRLLDAASGAPPARNTTGQLGGSAAAPRLPEPAGAEHVRVRSAVRCDDGVAQARQPTRPRERVMRRFGSSTSARRFLDGFIRAGDLLRGRRRSLAPAAYRATTRERPPTGRPVAGPRAA